jgi:hypothetical protein
LYDLEKEDGECIKGHAKKQENNFNFRTKAKRYQQVWGADGQLPLSC